jgi:hypothetical protein
MANHLPCGIELPQVFFDGPVDMEHIRKFATRAETSAMTVSGCRNGYR